MLSRVKSVQSLVAFAAILDFRYSPHMMPSQWSGFCVGCVSFLAAAGGATGQVVTSFRTGNFDLPVYDVARGRYATPVPANGLGFRGLAADNSGRVLYGTTGVLLYRMSFDGSQSPVAVGPYTGAVTNVSGGLAWDSLRGELLGTAADDILINTLVRIDPATAVTTLVRTVGSGDFSGLDYDPATDRLFSPNDSTQTSNGLAGRGLYVFVPPFETGPIVKVANYPGGELDIDGCAAGGGKVYLIEDEAQWMHVYDLGTGLFQAPVLQSPVGIDRVSCGGAWAPGLVQAAPTADVRLFLVDSPDPLGEVGGRLEYTAIVENLGPAASGPLVVSFELPPGALFVSSAPPGDAADGNVTAVLPTIASGDFSTVRVIVEGLGAGVHLCSATATGTLEDPDGSNNRDTEVTTVLEVADVSIDALGPGLCEFRPGEIFFLTFGLANSGPAAAGGAEFRCTVPEGSSFWYSEPSGFPIGGELFLDLGTFPAGFDQTVTVALLAEAGGVQNASASFASALSDPTPAMVTTVYRIRGGCAADFDASGSPDSDDIIAFFGDWDMGETCADVDGSGSVDSDDVVVFFGQWDAGGC